MGQDNALVDVTPLKHNGFLGCIVEKNIAVFFTDNRPQNLRGMKVDILVDREGLIENPEIYLNSRGDVLHSNAELFQMLSYVRMKRLQKLTEVYKSKGRELPLDSMCVGIICKPIPRG